MQRQAAKSFTDLIVWQKAHAFVLEVYTLTKRFPRSELYGLCSQFRRASVSIAANIAEGFKKKTSSDKARFFNIAQGSVEECQYYLILAHDLGYADTQAIRPRLDEVSKLLEAYYAALIHSSS